MSIYPVPSKWTEWTALMPADTGLRPCGCHGHFTSAGGTTFRRCRKHAWLCAGFWVAVCLVALASPWTAAGIVWLLENG